MRASAKKMLAQGPVEGKWNLPVGWEWKRLGEILPLAYGKALPAQSRVVGFTPVYGSSGEVGTHNEAITSGPTLIVGRKGNAGSVTLSHKPCWIIDTAYYATVDLIEIAKFWFYYLSFLDLGKLDQSTAIPSLSRDTYSALILSIPNDAIKERIVERIDSLFAELDKAEETLRHTITLCEQYKQSVLKAAVTGELSKEWRRTTPPKETGEQLLQHILKERRAAWEKAELAKMTAKGQTPTNDNWKKKYKEPQAPDTSGLPQLPDGWTWASMDMLGAWSGGGTPSKAVADFWEGSIPWVSSKDVKQYYIEDTELHISPVAVAESATNIIQKNSIVMVMRSGVLKHTFPVSIIRVDAAINQDIKSITLVLLINEHYLMTFLYAHNKKILASCAKDGTTVQSVEYAQLQKYPVPIPPVLEQKHIVKYARLVIEEIEGVIKMCHAQVAQTAALRQSILKQAFTGKLA